MESSLWIYSVGFVKFDLMLEISENCFVDGILNGLEGLFEYSIDFFKQVIVQVFVDCLMCLLEVVEFDFDQ